MRYILLSVFILIFQIAGAQFAPQAGLAGSDAVPHTSQAITGWATGCTVIRGLRDIAIPDSGYVTQGDSSLALGAADNFLVSLGDSGIATLTFAQPIANGAGADFLVFENGFRSPSDSEQAFLEFAFVEVSSDGQHFVRFPATSLTQTDTQVAGAGIYLNARRIDNLAGKYVSKWGTPFDLQDLPNDPLLDPMQITHVRLVDVIGSISDFGNTDKDGRRINDPYPTNFPTGGFDLDAVAVLHQATSIRDLDVAGYTFILAPNPATEYITITAKGSNVLSHYAIRDAMGRLLLQQSVQSGMAINLNHLSQGWYQVTVFSKDGASCTRSFLKY